VINRGPPPGAIAALPLRATLAWTYRTVVANAGALAKIAALPFLLGMAFDFVAPFITLPWQDPLRLIYFILIWTLFAVAWLRVVLLNETASARFFPRLTRRHLRLAGYALLLGILDLILLVGWYQFAAAPVAPQFPGLIYWIAYTFIGFVKLRFAFISAAVAVDERYSLRLAWRHSRNAALPLLVIFVAAVVLPSVAYAYGLNALSLEYADNFLLLYVFWMLWHAGTWAIEAVYVTVVAIAFRHCTGWVPAPDPRILERFE
jgi:hypothetical protein